MRAVVIFDNFGPYHLARLDACARVCDLTAIELAASSAEYAWKREGPGAGPQRSALNSSHFEHVTLVQRRANKKVRAYELVQKLTQALDRSRAEVVFIPGWSNRLTFAALRWCVRNNVPAVVMSESTEWDHHRVWWKESIKRKLLSFCRAALVGGAAHKDYIVKLGMPAERVFLRYNSVDNRYFADKAEETRKQRAETTKLYNLPRNYFLASARFITKKNLPRLLKAYALYREKSVLHFPASELWELVLLGDGPLRPDLCRLASDLGLDSWVHLPGFKQYSDLPAYYALASAFIHPSTTEQWGLVVNEAMASGLPVVVSNRCGCASELVKEGENGFTFDPTNEAELADIMTKISRNPENVAVMGRRSRQIIEDWSPERFAESTKDACENSLLPRPANRHYLERFILNLSIRLPEKAFSLSTGRGHRLHVQETEELPVVTVKPGFFIIGAPKSGTTSLSEYLMHHPNIFFSRVKEPHFFDSDTSRRLKLNLQTYLSLFSNADPTRHKAVGEGSTGYLLSSIAVREILKFNPDARFIAMLRNPLDLLQSWHAEMCFEGVEDVRDFEAAWRLEPSRRLGKSVPLACWEPRKLFYSEWGKLGDQVERLMSVANPERVKLIVFDDFVSDTKRVYEEVLAFLGIPTDGRTVFRPVKESRSLRHPGLQRSLAWLANYFRLVRATSGLKLQLGIGLSHKILLLNSTPNSRKPLSEALRAELVDFYREDVRKLSNLLGRDLSSWLSAKAYEYVTR